MCRSNQPISSGDAALRTASQAQTGLNGTTLSGTARKRSSRPPRQSSGGRSDEKQAGSARALNRGGGSIVPTGWRICRGSDRRRGCGLDLRRNPRRCGALPRDVGSPGHRHRRGVRRLATCFGFFRHLRIRGVARLPDRRIPGLGTDHQASCLFRPARALRRCVRRIARGRRQTSTITISLTAEDHRRAVRTDVELPRWHCT
jgi:hypothetical protein